MSNATVHGKLRQQDGIPLARVQVTVYDVGFRKERLLGEAETDGQGFYRVSYEAGQTINLSVRARDREGKELAASATRFAAGPDEEVDLLASSDLPGYSEYELVLEAVTRAAAGVPLAELSEERDADYLAGETGYDLEQIRALIQAARLGSETGLTQEALYGFVRETGAASAATLAARGSEGVRRTLQTAARRRIVSVRAVEDTALQRRVEDLAIERVHKQPLRKGQLPIAELITPLLPAGERQRAFLSEYARAGGRPEALIEKEDALSTLAGSPEQAVRLKLTLQLAALTGSNAGLMRRLEEKRTTGELRSIRDLAAYDEGAWRDLALRAEGIEDAEEEARRLARDIEAKFPTEVIAHRSVRDGRIYSPAVRTLFGNYLKGDAAFDLRRTLIRGFLKRNPALLESIPTEQHEAVITELKALQRVRKLTSGAPQMERLRSDGIHSAAQIARVGRSAFVEQYAGMEGGREEAARIHNNACRQTAAALAVVAEHRREFDQLGLAVMPMSNRNGAVDVPDLERLFNSFDLCDCAECRSVLSPAAYLVDLLHFLGNRRAEISGKSALDVLLERRPDLGETELTCENTNTALPYLDLVNEVLERAIAGGSETYIPIEYAADLQGGAVSPQLMAAFHARSLPLSASAEVVSLPQNAWHIREKGWLYKLRKSGNFLLMSAWPQTGSKAVELRTNPEHLNTPAYEVLRHRIYPWELPFDLWTEQVRAYLARLGVPRHELMQAFLSGEPAHSADAAISAEYLGFTATEWNIVAGKALSQERKPWKFWGFDAEDEPAVADLSKVPVLLERAGLEYKTLLKLLETRYINPFGALAIQSSDEQDAATCDTRKLVITNLLSSSGTALDPTQGNTTIRLDWSVPDRIHRFVRLWRKLGWDIREVDQALCGLMQFQGGPQWAELIGPKLASLQQAIRQALGTRIPSSDAASSFAATCRAVSQSIGAWLGTAVPAIDPEFSKNIQLTRETLKRILESRTAAGAPLAALLPELKRTAKACEEESVGLWRKTLLPACKVVLECLERLGKTDRELEEMRSRLRRQIERLNPKEPDRRALDELAEAVAQARELVKTRLGSSKGQLQTELRQLDAALAALDAAAKNLVRRDEILTRLIALQRCAADLAKGSPSCLELLDGLQKLADLQALLAVNTLKKEDERPPVLVDIERVLASLIEEGSITVETARALAAFDLTLEALAGQAAPAPGRLTLAAMESLRQAIRRQEQTVAELPPLLRVRNIALPELICRLKNLDASAEPLLLGVVTDAGALADFAELKGTLEQAAAGGLTVGLVADVVTRMYSVAEKLAAIAISAPAARSGWPNLDSLLGHAMVKNLLHLDAISALREVEEVLASEACAAGRVRTVAGLVDLTRWLELLSPRLEQVESSSPALRQAWSDLVQALIAWINACLASGLTEDVLIRLRHVQELHTDLKTPVATVLSWYAPLDTNLYGGVSFYQSLFQSPAVIRLRPGEADLFELNAPRVALRTADALLTDDEVTASLVAALRISAADLSVMSDGRDAGRVVAPALPDLRLTFDNLCRLYRRASLARALKLPVADLMRLEALSGISPFASEGIPVTSTQTERGRRFSGLLLNLKASGFTLAELEYLLRGMPDAAGAVAIRDEKIVSILSDLRSGLRQIESESAATSDPAGDLTRTRLELLVDSETAGRLIDLLAWDAKRFDELLAMFADTGYEVSPVKAYGLDRLQEPLRSKVAYSKGTLSFHGVMSPEEKQTLLGVCTETEFQGAVRQLFDAPRRELAGRLEELGAPVFSAPLAALPEKLEWPDAMKHRIWHDRNAGRLRFAGVMSRGDLDEASRCTEDAGTRGALRSLYEQPREWVYSNFKLFDAAISADLEAMPEGVEFPPELASLVYFDKSERQLSFAGILTEARATTLAGLGPQTAPPSAAQGYETAVQSLRRSFAAADPGADNAFLSHEAVAGLFDGEVGAPERFGLVLGRLLAHSRLDASKRLIRQKLGQAFGLDGDLIPNLLEKWVTGTRPSTHAMDVLLTPEWIASDARSELSERAWPDLFDTLKRLHGVALLIQRFGLTADPLRWVFEYGPANGWLDPNRLPVAFTPATEAATTAALFAGWERLLDLARLRDRWTDGSRRLSAIFEAAWASQGAAPAPDFLALVSANTGWSVADLQYLTSGRSLNIDTPARYRDEKAMSRLDACIRLASRLGVSAAQCDAWSKSALAAGDSLTVEDTRSARQALKARYADEQWADIAQPLADRFREAQRDAMVAYLIRGRRPVCWEDANALSAAFLIDVQMAAGAMMTSRIKQACSSVQLFVQRCLMNLEPKVRADAGRDEHWLEWQWMKNYRVWEANRKIFLYPENWIEPDLRDDKSPFFEELENELTQNEITDDTAETALVKYIAKLDEVARLEICAVAHEGYPSGDVDRLHVVGRTPNSPHTYYYRQRIDSLYWTPWEKIDIDIQSEHHVLAAADGHVRLFWLTYKEKNKPKSLTVTSGEEVREPGTDLHVNLVWSDYRNGGWTKKQISKQTALIPWSTGSTCQNGLNCWSCERERKFGSCFEPKWKRHPKTVFFENWGDLTCVSVRWQIARDGRAWFQTFNFAAGPNSQPELSQTGWNYFIPNAQFDDADGHCAREFMYFRGSGELMLNRDSWMSPLLVHIDTGAGEKPKEFRIQSFVGDTYIYSDNQRTFGLVFRNAMSWCYFQSFYHPFARILMKQLGTGGVTRALERKLQINPDAYVPRTAPFDFDATYGRGMIVERGITEEVMDFQEYGAYAQYNWEIFFHVPLLIADRLSKNQRFEDAMKWFHYIFNPMDASTDGEEPQQHYWQTKPFFQTKASRYQADQVTAMLESLADGKNPGLETAIERWRKDPFKPHLVARTRTTAFQKTVVMKYIDNLIAWGDQLFRRDTIESINEATQLYVLAAEILGRRPEITPPRFGAQPRTYNSLPLNAGDDFSDPLVDSENLVTMPGFDGPLPPELVPPVTLPQILYFGVPKNDRLWKYWDVVADRLWKIRHGLNIEGVARQLALFEPPIDPAMLVRAAAAGIDLSDVLSDVSGPTPHYRFSFLAQKAAELCAEVKALGAALLGAMEKRDAETLAALRTAQELALVTAVRDVKAKQVEEAKATLDGLTEYQQVVQARFDYYSSRAPINAFEGAHLSLMAGSIVAQGVQMGLEITGGALHLVPETKIGAPTSCGVTYGGGNLGASLQSFASAAGTTAAMLSASASVAATLGGYQRRTEDWVHQTDLAARELKQVNKQIEAATVRNAIAEKELENHDLQVDHARELDELMREKFTNQQLYDWMVGQISSIYFQSYQLAYDVAKRCEHTYRFELGVEDSNFIQFGYWDSLKKGLMAGERLSRDIRRMEVAYLDRNKREFELTRHVSLLETNPLALLQLRATGSCTVSLGEELFDLDCPGHYFRRLKSVAITIPCVTGPYASVNCKLTLLKSSIRRDPVGQGDYARQQDVEDPRFSDAIGNLQAVVTSTAQSDSGLFETNLRDERYLPFEGAGAISEWRLELPAELRQFDYDTIADVLLQIRYTAKDGGDALRSAAVANLKALIEEARAAGSSRLFSVRHEFPDEWARFTAVDVAESSGQGAALGLELSERYFPVWSRGRLAEAKDVLLIARPAAATKARVGVVGTSDVLAPDPRAGGLLTGKLTNIPAWVDGKFSFALRLDDNSLSDLWLLVAWAGSEAGSR